jgi:hypothetical protein
VSRPVRRVCEGARGNWEWENIPSRPSPPSPVYADPCSSRACPLTGPVLVPSAWAGIEAQARHGRRAGLARARPPSCRAGYGPCQRVPGHVPPNGPAQYGHVYPRYCLATARARHMLPKRRAMSVRCATAANERTNPRGCVERNGGERWKAGLEHLQKTS